MKKLLTFLMCMAVAISTFGQTTVSVTRQVKANLDTVVKTTTTTVDSVIKKYVPPVVTQPGDGKNPGGPELQVLTYNNQSNITLVSKTITGKSLVFNNCTNIVVNLCTFNGGKGTNAYAVTFNNCTNVTATFNFGTMYCNFFRVKGGTNIKVNSNQLLNLYEPKIYLGDFAHAIRFESVTGAGNEVKDNIIENVPGVCVNPHDIINLVNCSGTSASHFLVSGNKIRGGMIVDGFNLGTGAGITLDNGLNIDVVKNTGVNNGAAFIQANTYNGGTHTNVLIDSNIGVSLIKSSVAHDGIVALGSKTNVTISNNKINWINLNGKTGTNFPGGEVLFWFGGSANPNGIKRINNTFDKTLTANVLPAVMITYHL